MTIEQQCGGCDAGWPLKDGIHWDLNGRSHYPCKRPQEQRTSKERLCPHGMTLETGCMYCKVVDAWDFEIERLRPADETSEKLTGIDFLFAWMAAKNPMLGGWSPLEMMDRGRGEKLAAFIRQAQFDSAAENGDGCL